MGLLEKHLNELQSKPSSKDKKDSEDNDNDEKTKESKTNKKVSSNGSSKPKSSEKKKAIKGDDKASEITPQALNSMTGFVRSLPSTHEQKETPAMDMKETDAQKKSQETVPAAATGEKKQILPKASIETPVDEPAYEVSEPNTVKSILARAKEVLKSLDEEKDDQSSDGKVAAAEEEPKSAKKSDITRKQEETDDEKDAEEGRKVKQVAKLAASLAKTANKYKNAKAKGDENKNQNGGKSTGKSASQFSLERKPKPGPKKSGLSATGPGQAGMGNTP